MNITQLRNDLLHFCSSEITGVTLADLKECNWKTQKIVYSGIIQTSNRLKVYQEQLVLLNENRARNLTMLRSQVGSRDDRKQIEIEYRHRFLELIANILCELKWPPTLEPFSNPLRLLTEEIEYKLGAMRFLLDSAVFKPSRQMSWKSYGGMEPDANSELTPRSSNDNSIKRESLPQSDVLAADQNDVVLSRVDRSPSSMHSRNEDNSPTIASTKLDYSYFDYHLLFQSHQILQNQCEVLSKQLKFIKSAINARSMAEQKFESVMKDFQKSLSVLSNLNQEKEKVLDGRNVQAIRGDMTSNKSVSSWKDAERLVGTYISSWQQAQRDARIAVLNSSTATVARREAEKCNYPRYNVSQLSAGGGYFIDTSSIDAPMTDADESQHFTLAQFEDLARLSATHYPIARAEKVVDSLCINIQRLLDLQGHLIDFSIQLKHFANVLETDIQDQRILQKEECKPMIAGLLQSCGTLIVNSSSLSPFCPLELPSCNQQSACDGLDALIDSAFEIAGKRINHKLKNCVLRARSEQNALLMQLHYFQCLNVSYKTILSSLKKSSKSTNIIEGKKLHLILNELKKFREMLLSIMSAIQQAEDARVKIPLAAFQNQLSNRTLHPNAAPAVNPLDALARGILGEKVAELVFTLRSMRQSLESLPERIEIIEQQLQ